MEKSMKVESYKENEDGSASLEVDLTPYEVSILLESAIAEAIKQYVDKHERDTKLLDRPDLPNNSFKI